MWYRDRVWIQFVKNIMAVDGASARMLASYRRSMELSGNYANALEVFDLQRYKAVRGMGKVRNILRDKKNTPFIFVTCMN